MNRKPIPFDHFSQKPVHLWDIQWLLLTSGDFNTNSFNAMTVGWGSMGYMWRRPFVQVVVRPVRYTYQFMEKFETFTLAAFPWQYHSAVQLLGRKSGRDGNKIKESGLTPTPSSLVAAPSYAEASLVIECRKIYWDDFDPTHFIDPKIEDCYPAKDYHRIYFGEVLVITGTDEFTEKEYK